MSTTTDSDSNKTKPPRAAISRIAVGIDGYPEGNDAAALGAAIAAATDAELMLVAVHTQPLVVLPEQINWKNLNRQAAALLRETRSSFAPDARMVVENDLSVPRALERVVRRRHRDLLVVGSSRHGPDGKVRMSKRTRQLLGHFRSALAIAPRGMHNRQERGLTRIGVGFDAGAESRAALALAGSIARAADAELHLCGVVDDRVPPIKWSALLAGRAAVPSWEETVLANMDELRESARSRAQETGVRAQVDIRRGRPADALLELSEKMDLLVIGSRRWGRFARLLLGSTGEALAHDVACPLLVVPRPAGRSGLDRAL